MTILGLFNISRGESLDRIYLFKLFGYGVFLHHIHASDPDLYHNHPWNGFSFIFGSYWEVFRDSPAVFRLRCGFNRLTAKRHHRVLVDRPVWTLFFHGPKCNTWEIVDDAGRKVTKPWEGAEGVKSYTDATKG